MHDLWLLLIYRVPAAAFGLLFVLTLVIPAVHSLLVVARVMTGRPAGINWWVIGRVLPLVLAAFVAVPLLVMARQWTGDWLLTVAEIALVYLSVAVIVVPVALPLVQAYVSRLPRFGTLLYAVLAILSLPVAAALATHASALATEAIDVTRNAAGLDVGPVALTMSSSISACTQTLTRIVPEGIVASLPAATSDLETTYPAYFFFWVDMSLKAMFLDFFEVFDCGVSNLRPNPNHAMFSSFVFFYRAFVSVIVFSVLALPFRSGRA
jgi:hypothetical protein